MTFVNLRGLKKAFDRDHSNTKVVLRWHASTERPHIYGYPISRSLVAWLDANCVGQWYEVINREHAIEDILLTKETQDLFWEARIARKDGMEYAVDPDVLRRATSTREIAFTNKNDALIFKLLWCGDV